VTSGDRIRAADEELRKRVQRRTLAVVVASQVLGGAGLAAGVTVGALLAQQLVGADSLAGLPAALFTLGSAGAAFVVGRVSQRRGRRVGLGLGFCAGGLGALGVVVAAATVNIPLLFVALLVYGAGTATNLQARYAGSDLAAPSARGTAVSVALVSTTLGAVAGPNLVAPMGSVAAALGIPALAGPFLLAAAAYLAAGLVLAVLLRPDPLLLARRLAADAEAEESEESTAEDAAAEDETRAEEPATATSASPPLPPVGRGAIVGAAVMILTQIAMVAIMTMTPVEMRAHHHDLSEVGVVIGIHIAAMYLPSPLTGLLVDRVGRIPIAIAAAVTLLAAGIVGAVAPANSLGLLVLALALLGLGWNFGLISGTALVVDATVPANRARTQGTIDVLIALAGAGGGAMSGVVMASAGYALLSIAGGLLSALLVPVVFWAMRPRAAVQAGP
jgi:MFS family permease